MGKINFLSDKIANMIAAGEVVERPSSVVKELVENSIDASANKITIKINEAGRKSIKVSDDGEGMEKDDFSKAFMPHATSKIKEKNDLFNIETLGFRGEALASIVAVAKVEAKSSKGKEAYKIVLEKGNKKQLQKTNASKGTSIEVKNLFINTPARLKHLKSDSYELARIYEIVSKNALANPHVGFSLYSEGKLTFHSPGRGDLVEVISSLYGLKIAKGMNNFKGENPDFSINGYTSSIGISRASPNFITTILNGRFVKIFGLQKEISKIYEPYLFGNRFPITIISIKTDPALIDVNVHPSKQEVRISKEKELYDLVKKQIENIFEKENIAPKIESNQKEFKTIKEEQTSFDLDYSSKRAEQKEPLKDSKKEIQHNKINNLNVIGQFGAKYIIASDGELLYLIDQHAAAERIKYEKLKEKLLNKETWSFSELLFPIVLTFSKDEYLKLKNNFDKLKELGLELEEFGNGAIRITQVPTWMKNENVEFMLEEITQKVLDEKQVKVEELKNDALSSLSCKAALKANKHLNNEELSRLIDDLFMCKNPYTCPHGRPLIIYHSLKDLDKMFKRS